MHEHMVLKVLCLVAMVTTASFALGATKSIDGRVVRVIDGNTVTIVDARKQSHQVRLAGIDAPVNGQPYATQAREALATLILNHDVHVLWKRRDHRKQIVGWVSVPVPATPDCSAPCERDAGLFLVQAGLAWHDEVSERQQPTVPRLLYAREEIKAFDARLGLWADKNAVPPWDWRKAHPSGSTK